jgi:hypothetical protein
MIGRIMRGAVDLISRAPDVGLVREIGAEESDNGDPANLTRRALAYRVNRPE